MSIDWTRGMVHSGPCLLLTLASREIPLPLPERCEIWRRKVSCLTKAGTGICRLFMTARMTSSALPRISSAAFLSLGVFCRLTITSWPPAQTPLSDCQLDFLIALCLDLQSPHSSGGNLVHEHNCASWASAGICNVLARVGCVWARECRTGALPWLCGLPALGVRRGRSQAGVICRLVPRQMARSAALAASSDAVSSSSGRASSQSRMKSFKRPLHSISAHLLPVRLKPTCSTSSSKLACCNSLGLGCKLFMEGGTHTDVAHMTSQAWQFSPSQSQSLVCIPSCSWGSALQSSCRAALPACPWGSPTADAARPRSG